MGEKMPKLTRAQLARLIEVARGVMPFATIKEKTTAACLDEGVLEAFSEARNGGTYRMVRPTAFGIRVLAGLPGDEFDRFRAMLAEPDPRPRGAAGEGGAS